MMTKADVTDLILQAKRDRGLSWASISETIDMSEVFTTSACLGMNSFPVDKARALATHLELPDEAATVLAEYPNKTYAQLVPTDPCIYRFYEIMGVYGETLKQLMQEKKGDGIMSAIDFHMSVDVVEDPKGDRIEVTMSGKFLPYNAWWARPPRPARRARRCRRSRARTPWSRCAWPRTPGTPATRCASRVSTPRTPSGATAATSRAAVVASSRFSRPSGRGSSTTG